MSKHTPESILRTTTYARFTNEELLTALDAERSLFTKSDKVVAGKPTNVVSVMQSMVEELIARGVYPAETVAGNPNSVYQMVKGWGARWHVWNGVLFCPHCAADLREHQAGPPFRRSIAVYSREQDRTTDYQCPDCEKRWERRDDV